MNALNRAFIKAYRDPSRTEFPSGPHIPMGNRPASDPNEPTSTTAGGMIYSSESWEVIGGASGALGTWCSDVEEVSPEAPVRASIVRVDEPQPLAVNKRSNIRSPHWVFVPLTRREKTLSVKTQAEMKQTSQSPAIERPTTEKKSKKEHRKTAKTASRTAIAEKTIEKSAASENKPNRSKSNETVIPVIERREPWLRPALEVDHLRWPDACDCIIAFTGEQLDRCVRQLLTKSRQGQRVVMVTGHARGEGRTTFLLSLARRLSAAGVKTAIVDGDFANPQLARHLGLVPETGWEDALTGRMPLSEVMIDSLEDKVSLLPTVGSLRSTSQIETDSWSESLDALKVHFQVVLIDAPPADEFLKMTGEELVGIDAAILLQRGAGSQANTGELARQFQSRGISLLGRVENFA